MPQVISVTPSSRKSRRPTGLGNPRDLQAVVLVLRGEEQHFVTNGIWKKYKELCCPLVIILLIIIRPDKWNKETLSHKATGNQTSWLNIKPNPKRPGYKLNSFFLPFSSSGPISGLCFLVSIFSSGSIPLQLAPVILSREKHTLFRWEIIKLNITQPLKCRQLITRAKLNILTDVV